MRLGDVSSCALKLHRPERVSWLSCSLWHSQTPRPAMSGGMPRLLKEASMGRATFDLQRSEGPPCHSDVCTVHAAHSTPACWFSQNSTTQGLSCCSCTEHVGTCLAHPTLCPVTHSFEPNKRSLLGIKGVRLNLKPPSHLLSLTLIDTVQVQRHHAGRACRAAGLVPEAYFQELSGAFLPSVFVVSTCWYQCSATCQGADTFGHP